MTLQTPEEERAELARIEREMDEAEAAIFAELRRIRQEEDTAREAAEQLKPRYRCDECGHVCQERHMESDEVFNDWDEAWSSHICPNCKFWHDGLRPGEGWTRVEP
jgi:predicted RNA-binding Zn-ribbon protein involved in translation (DUF1610 family)